MSLEERINCLERKNRILLSAFLGFATLTICLGAVQQNKGHGVIKGTGIILVDEAGKERAKLHLKDNLPILEMQSGRGEIHLGFYKNLIDDSANLLLRHSRENGKEGEINASVDINGTGTLSFTSTPNGILRVETANGYPMIHMQNPKVSGKEVNSVELVARPDPYFDLRNSDGKVLFHAP